MSSFRDITQDNLVPEMWANPRGALEPVGLHFRVEPNMLEPRELARMLGPAGIDWPALTDEELMAIGEMFGFEGAGAEQEAEEEEEGEDEIFALYPMSDVFE